MHEIFTPPQHALHHEGRAVVKVGRVMNWAGRTRWPQVIGVAGLLLLAASCGDSPPAASPMAGTAPVSGVAAPAFPSGPAPCAGPDRTPPDARAFQWQQALEGTDEPLELWISLSRKQSIEEALALADGFTVLGEVAVFPFNQASVLKASQDAGQGRAGSTSRAVAEPSAAAIRALLQRRLASTFEDAVLPNDPGVVEGKRLLAQGDIPIGAIHVRGTRASLRRVLEQHPCDVYAIRSATAQPPLLSSAVDPT